MTSNSITMGVEKLFLDDENPRLAFSLRDKSEK